MSDSSNKPSFTFGQATSSGGTSNLFGQTTSSAPPSTGIFGSASTAPATSGGGLFGSATTTAPSGSLFGASAATSQAPSSFGSATSGSNLFGSKPATSGFSFGSAGAGSTAGSGLFGAAQPATTTSSSTAPLFSTPSKPTDATSTSQPPTNIFGGSSTSGNVFGNPSGGLGSSTTPTNKPTTSLFNTSTTPAGPPPVTSSGAASESLFRTNAPSPFTQSSATTSTENKPQEAPNTTSAPQTSNIFGGAPNTASRANTAPTLFGATPSTQPASNVFGNLGKPQVAGNNQATTQANPGESKPATGGLFANLGAKSSASESTTKTTNASSLFGNNPAQPSFSFAKASEAPSNPTVKSPTTKPAGGFSFGNATSSAPAAPATSNPTTNLFPSLGKPQASSSATSGGATNTTTTTAPSTSTTSGPSVFSLGKPSAPSTSTSEKPTETSKPPADESKPSGTNFGSSTTGPAPAARSRLKDKTMDDIITRWASDLSKYQKQFQSQAEKVAQWDRMLVENSEKIQRLYGSTLEAERATTEVERQLTSVESDQAELEQWLDHYEKEVNQMMDNQVGQGEGTSGPDAERENTYHLATRISDRLEEMGKDLGSMIEEINDASSNLSKHTKPDDPLSQVVRVLNSHLTQLQQIDQGANALQAKVKEAQKYGQGLSASGGLNGPSSDAAEGFYRSLMGRG